MLQAIRSRATSFVVKILFGLLIVTFGIWGIGDIFRSGAADDSVATVGGRPISAAQVSQAVQADIDRMRGLFGGTIDTAQVKQLGILDQAVQRLVTQNLVELELNRMNLAIGDEAVRNAIVGNAAFKNQQGIFDRNIYAQVLLANHLTEQQFEALQRSDLLKAQLTAALTDGMAAPKPLVDLLYRARAERRTADLVVLAPANAGAVPKPAEDQIAAFYEAHKDRFLTPERRSFTAAFARLDDIAAGMTVGDDELKKEYDQRQDEFHNPEERDVEQMLLPDETTAQKAKAALDGGKDFAAVAKDVAGMDDPKALDLGFVKRDDLPPELSGPAFDVAEGATAGPVKSTFGWHILKVDKIKPAEAQSLDQVKDKLRLEIARDHAGDKLADLANSIDDALAGGVGFNDVVQKFGLKTATADAVDIDGKDAAGKPLDLGDGQAGILKTAFATETGKVSPLSEMGDQGYFIVSVGAVTPAATEPLAAVHDEAARLWQDDARQQQLQKLADGIADEVKSGKSLKDVAAQHKLALTTTAALPRTGGDQKVPPALVAKLFDAKDGEAVVEPSGDGVVVAQLKGIEPADPAKDETAVKDLAQQLSGGLQGDMLDEFNDALKRNFPVKIDQSKLDQVL